MIGVCKQTLRSILRGLPYVYSPAWLSFLLSEMSLLMSLRSNHLTRGVPIIEVIEGRRIDLSRLAIKFGSFAYAPNPTVKPSLEDFRNEPVLVLGRRLHGAASYSCLLLTNWEMAKRYNVLIPADISPEYVAKINAQSDESLLHVDFVDAMFLGANDYDAPADDPNFNADSFDPAPPPTVETPVIQASSEVQRASSPELSSLISRPHLAIPPASYRDVLAPRALVPASLPVTLCTCSKTDCSIRSSSDHNCPCRCSDAEAGQTVATTAARLAHEATHKVHAGQHGIRFAG